MNEYSLHMMDYISTSRVVDEKLKRRFSSLPSQLRLVNVNSVYDIVDVPSRYLLSSDKEKFPRGVCSPSRTLLLFTSLGMKTECNSAWYMNI